MTRHIFSSLILSAAAVACLMTPAQADVLSVPAPHTGAVLIEASAAQTSDQMGMGAQKFIGNMGDQAIGFLSNAGMSMTQKEGEFRKLLRSSFDMRTIGRFALGRYWNVATADQQREYQTLFEDMIVNVYSARFNDYKGQKFEARSFRREGDKDTLVTSYILPTSGQPVQVDWRVRYKDGAYKIVDVIVEGVSMAMTQRSDFASVIQSGGGSLQTLLSHLRERNRT